MKQLMVTPKNTSPQKHGCVFCPRETKGTYKGNDKSGLALPSAKIPVLLQVYLFTLHIAYLTPDK
jgi:hypothetical protein